MAKRKRIKNPLFAGQSSYVPLNLSRGVGVVNELIFAIRNPFVPLTLVLQTLADSPAITDLPVRNPLR